MILKGFTFDIQVTLAVFAVQHMQTYATLGENVLRSDFRGGKTYEGEMSGGYVREGYVQGEMSGSAVEWAERYPQDWVSFIVRLSNSDHFLGSAASAEVCALVGAILVLCCVLLTSVGFLSRELSSAVLSSSACPHVIWLADGYRSCTGRTQNRRVFGSLWLCVMIVLTTCSVVLKPSKSRSEQL